MEEDCLLGSDEGPEEGLEVGNVDGAKLGIEEGLALGTYNG